MSVLAGSPAALAARASEQLSAAALAGAAADELRLLAAEGESIALEGARRHAMATARLLDEAHARYRDTAMALHDYACALRHAQHRAETAPEHALAELDAAAWRAIAAIDTAVTPPDDDGGRRDPLDGALGPWLGLAAGLSPALGIAASLRRGARADAPELAQARRLLPDSLDGRPYEERDARHRALLGRLLAAGSGIGPATRTRLGAVAETLRQYPDARLISFWLDGEEPRVAFAFGDLEQADSVTYVVHGIDTDAAQSASHSRPVRELYADAARHPGRHEAFVAWLNYDSGGVWTEPGTALADRGAQTLIADVEALRRRNPGAEINGIFHSYGSTTFGQVILVHPDAFDRAYLLGSPGLSPEAARALESAIAGGRIEAHATQARSDSIATLGRSTTWEHPESPLALRGVSVFSSEAYDAAERLVITGRGILRRYDPGSGGVDGHDLDRPENGAEDYFGYLTRDSVAYRYIRGSLLEGD